jgi:hypothetical protein
MSYQLCILRTRSLLLLSVAVCLKYTTGCVTRISPSTPENIVKEERECAEHAETACGQIAFTIGLEKRTFYSNPNVEIVVVDLDTGKSRYLLAPVSLSVVKAPRRRLPRSTADSSVEAAPQLLAHPPLPAQKLRLHTRYL